MTESSRDFLPVEGSDFSGDSLQEVKASSNREKIFPKVALYARILELINLIH
jgi:hypothetical protein